MRRRLIIVLAVIAVAFTFIAFVAPFIKNEVFWSAYAFGIVAIAAQFYFARSAFGGKGTAKSRVYGFPIARVGAIYVAVQFIASLAQMVLSTYLPAWAGFALNVAILVLALLGCIGTEVARDAVAKMDTSVSTNTQPMTDIRLTCEALLARCEDGKLQVKLAELTEAIRFSDPTSDDATAAAEEKIKDKLDAIGKAIDTSDTKQAHVLISQTLLAIRERNAIRKARRRG